MRALDRAPGLGEARRVEVIQQLRGPNFTQFWPPTPLSGQLRAFLLIPIICSRDQVWTFYSPPTHLFLSMSLKNDPRAQSESWSRGNTFSTKMLFGSVLIVYTGLIYNIEAIGPVVSNNELTPVVNSQRVYLSPEVLAKYRQQELQETAQER